VLLRELGAVPQARQAALQGLERSVGAPVIQQRLRLVLGSVLLDAGERDEAVATLVRAGPLQDPRHLLLRAAGYALVGRGGEARDDVQQGLQAVGERADRDGHWLRVLGWAVLGQAEPDGLAAASLFAAQTFDPALTAATAILAGRPPEPRTLACSYEARLVRQLDRCHSSSHRRDPLLR
jgi:hypothetical protein